MEPLAVSAVCELSKGKGRGGKTHHPLAGPAARIHCVLNLTWHSLDNQFRKRKLSRKLHERIPTLFTANNFAILRGSSLMDYFISLSKSLSSDIYEHIS